MAQAKKTNGILGAALAAGLSAATAFVPAAASADDVTPVLQEQNAAMLQLEADQLGAATDAAFDYAIENYGVGVGIVFHVGHDLQSRPDYEQMKEKIRAYFTAEFAKRGVPVEIFESPSLRLPSSGLTYHLKDTIHGSENGKEVKNFGEAEAAIIDVIAKLKAPGPKPENEDVEVSQGVQPTPTFDG